MADQVSVTRYVVDTGAAVSLVSPSLHSSQERPVCDLLAANRILITTYGTKALHLILTPNALLI